MKKHLAIALLLFLVSTSSFAQFTNIYQSITNTFEFAEISESNGVALIGGFKVGKSIDAGFTWTELDLGIYGIPWSLYEYTDAIIISPTTYCLVGRDDTNDKGIIIRTTDGGLTWSSVLTTPNNSFNFFLDICYNGSVVIATGKGGVYRSIDNGLTWTYIPTGSSVFTSRVIQYNAIENTWIMENSTYVLKKSTDNGLTWQTIVGTYPLGLNYGITNAGAKFVSTRSTSISSVIFFIDPATFPPADTVTLPAIQTYNTLVEKSTILPDNSVFAYSYAYLMNVDTSNSNVYFYNHNLIQPPGGVGGGGFAQVYDFDFDQSYGLAVGQYGAVSRFNYASPADLYVSAEFTLTSSSCPSQPIQGIPAATYADSVKWYYDDVLVSTDDTLNYTTPYAFGSHEIKHRVWYGGNLQTDSSSIYYNQLTPAPNVSFGNFDPTPCFQSGVNIPIITSNGGGSTTREIWRNGVLISSISPCPNTTYYYNIPAVYTQDTIRAITRRQQTCGVSADTALVIIYPGNDLSDEFMAQGLDSALCYGEQLMLYLDGTNPAFEYNVSFTSNPIAFSTNVSQFGSGLPGLSFSGPAVLPNYYLYESDLLCFVSVSVEDPTQNCFSPQILIDTVLAIAPHAAFESESANYFLGDTVSLTNIRPQANLNWEVIPSGLNVQNPTDTVPLIYGSNAGLYEIQLTQNPLPSCSDTTWRTIRYGDEIPNLGLQICESEVGGLRLKVIDVKSDFQGNLYELGIINATGGNGSGKPGFHLVKRDENGQLLWQRVSANLSGSTYGGSVIEDIDFDDAGDVYIALWISSEWSYNFDLINYIPSSSYDQKSYLVKLDGQTGDMIWFKDIGTFPLGTMSGYWRMKSIAVSDNRIYFSCGTKNLLTMVCATMSGDYIEHENIYGPGPLTPTNMHVYTGSLGDVRQSNHSPRLKKTPSGGVVGVAYYEGTPEYNGVDIPGLSINTEGVFVFKYEEGSGLQNFVKVAEGEDHDAWVVSNEGIPRFDVDQNGNVALAFSRRETNFDVFDYDHTYQVMDSVFRMKEGTCVVMLDQDFNLKWFTVGSYFKLQSVSIADATGDVYISGVARDNIGFSRGDEHSVAGNYFDYQTQYGTSVHFWDMVNYSAFNEDPFIVALDSSGGMKGALYFDAQQPFTWFGQRITVRSLVNPCGEVFCAFNNGYPDTLEFLELYTGQSITVDDCISIIFKDTCSSQVCSYLSLNYNSLNVCSGSDSVFVPLGMNSYNVNLVTYSLYDGATLELNNTVPVVNQGFYIPLANQAANYSFIIDSPGSGTSPVQIQIVPPMTAIFQPTYSVDCGDSLTISYSSANFPQSSWFLNGIATANNFLPDSLQFGLNLVEVTLTDINGCTSDYTMNIDYCNNIGLEEDLLSSVLLFPNPNSGSFTIANKSSNAVNQLMVYSSDGKLLLEHYPAEKEIIEMKTDLAPGVYHLVLVFDEQHALYKLVIE